MQLYCSMLGVIYQTQTEHLSFFIIALTYSAICLFSFINLTYVRDFDALQINITPIILSIAAIIALNRQFDLTLLGLALALLGDSYCALRFKDNSDKIKYTPIEEFAK